MMKRTSRKTKLHGFLSPRLEALFGIRERWRFLAFTAIIFFTLLYVFFLASQQVRPSDWHYTIEPQQAGWQASPPDEMWSRVDLPFLQMNTYNMYHFKGYVELSGLLKPDVIVGVQDKVVDVYVNGVSVPLVTVDSNQVEASVYGLQHNAYVIPASYFRDGRNLVALSMYGRQYAILGFSVPKAIVGNSRVYALFLLTPLLLFLVLKKESLSLNATAVVVFLILALVFLKPLFQNFNYWGSRDWDIGEAFNAIPRETILHYRQIPLWSPYFSGGQPLLADPHSSWLTPLYFVVLVFDVIAGLKIQTVLMYVVGLFGMYLLGKQFKLNTYACYLTAFAFMFSSFYSLHLSEGHFSFTYTSLIPWSFLFYLKALDDKKYVVLSALVIALILLGGGAHILIYNTLFLILYALTTSVKELLDGKSRREIINPLATLCAIGILCLALGAIKLLPAIELLTRYPRLTGGDVLLYDGYTANSLYYAFLGRIQMKFVSDEMADLRSNWHEFGAYVGPVVLALAAGGVIFCFRKQWPLAVVILLGILLSFGKNQAEMVLWDMLHKLPVFSSLRSPSRAILIALLPLSVFAGCMASRLEERKRWVALVLAVVVFYNLMAVNTPTLGDAFTIAPRAINKTGFVQLTGTSNVLLVYTEAYKHFLQNQGLVNAGPMLWLSQAPASTRPADDIDYQGEFYLLGGSGAVTVTSFTPNKITLSVNVQDRDYLIVNQNYDSGWKTPGRVILNHEGLLAVEVSPADSGRDIILYYSPTSFKIGLAVSAASLAAVWYVLRVWRGRGGGRRVR